MTAVDVERGRIFYGNDPDSVDCYRLTDSPCETTLWKAQRKEFGRNPVLNPRTGDLFILDFFARGISGETGAPVTQGWVEGRATLVGVHPEQPVTVFIRRGEPQEGVALWKRKVAHHISFCDELNGEVSEVVSLFKESPHQVLFLGDRCYIDEMRGVIHCFDFRSPAEIWSLSLSDKWFRMQSASLDRTRNRLVLKVNRALLFVDPQSGEEIGHREVPLSWGQYHEMDCLLDNGTKLLLMDGRMFDVETMECIEEGVFAGMGLIFGPPESGGAAQESFGL